MSGSAKTISVLRGEVDRLAAGGKFDATNATKLLTMAVLQLEDWQQAYYGVYEERLKLGKQVATNRELLSAMAMLLEIGEKAVRGEINEYAPIEFMRDVAPFKNLFASVYGLDSAGGVLPVRKLRKKTRKQCDELAKGMHA